MNKIEKFLKILTPKERWVAEELLFKIKQGDIAELNIKKLKGYENLYRVRKGDLRVIFYSKDGDVNILDVCRKSDNTYNF
ncbi:MAG: type II toxin-antitoxin system RelE/ParE family toxin [Candidatus Paceibacterota bacterium]